MDAHAHDHDEPDGDAGSEDSGADDHQCVGHWGSPFCPIRGAGSADLAPEHGHNRPVWIAGRAGERCRGRQRDRLIAPRIHDRRQVDMHHRRPAVHVQNHLHAVGQPIVLELEIRNGAGGSGLRKAGSR